jgi:long-chain acyl-CoA synthetase
VGPPIAGVEVAVGDSGEILTRGPNVMLGYYNRDDATSVTVRDGWLHTGDVGEIDGDGFVRLTGRIKNLFKLSTGKYVMPQPLEQRLEAEPLVEHALVVGEGEKYCAALLFVGAEALAAFAQRRGLTGEVADLLGLPEVRERIRAAVEQANRDQPNWSCVKRAVMMLGDISIANDLLTPTLKLRREPVLSAYGAAVDALYHPDGKAADAVIVEMDRR